MLDIYPASVIFTAVGHDERVVKLDSLTGTSLYNKPQQCEDGAHFIELTAVADAPDEDSAVEQAREWVERHAEILQDLDADKRIEFQTAIGPEWGSRSLGLPLDFVKLLASINARILHQFCRIASEPELEEMRRQGRGPRSRDGQ